ncbi:MAG: pseudaminic acid cytidylyltransferase [Desulfobacteraceae bacterium]|nr:pseudaminic acid cytidylyltransferase [Desulfobacteraceae bacterium]
MKLCVIPARGGSKRIPQKNIRLFAGKPIIAYSIQTALRSALFDKVIVSTDDMAIAKVAKEFGAEIPFMRPNHLADDFTGTNSVVKHAIAWYEERGHAIDYACCIYATAPFLQIEYLREGFEKLVSSGKAFAFSVTTFSFPIQRALRMTANSSVEAIFPENVAKRSQDLEETYHDAGQFYWGTAEAFLNDLVTFSDISVPVCVPRHLVQDIDTLEDWDLAEKMYHVLKMMEDEQSASHRAPVEHRSGHRFRG